MSTAAMCAATSPRRMAPFAGISNIPIMQVCLFISDKEPRVRAFTSDEMGGNLPAEYAPWRALNSGRAMTIGSTSDAVFTAIARNGFFLLSGSSQQQSGSQGHGDGRSLGRSRLNKKAGAPIGRLPA
jgi:hypothetical protein